MRAWERNRQRSTANPDRTRQRGRTFFAANKVEIAKDLTEAIRGVGVGLKDLTADMPRIEHFFDRMAKVWHYLNMTPGELVTAAMGGRDSPFYKPHLGMSDSDYYATQDGGAPVGYHTGRGRFGNYLKTGGIPTGAAELIKGLRDRGLDAEHAAILGGNIEQESNFDPTAFNAREGAVGPYSGGSNGAKLCSISRACVTSPKPTLARNSTF